MGILNKTLSAGMDKQLHRYEKRVKNDINPLEEKYSAMTSDELRAANAALMGEARGEKPDDTKIVNEGLALMREVTKRTTGKRAFDVQLEAALALWEGNIAEAKTGEGKSLVSHFPQYLGLIYNKQVHQVTVNEYLAKRDHDEAASIFDALGFKVGYIYNQQPNDSKREAYACNVVYGTPSEFGFDYLRDNMVQRYEDKLQKEHSYAIIDEIDSILIDEARTPLIISGPGNSAAKTYTAFAKAVKGLERGEEPDFDPLMGNKPEPTGEYVLDEAKRTIAATEKGLAKIESRLGFKVYADATGTLANHLQQALKAEYMFHRDKDYIVIDGEVKIVDENTGRIMEGRRWSDGLHQAIEAKEHVEIQEENQTLATVTLQNFFRLYDKLCGMTGDRMHFFLRCATVFQGKSNVFTYCQSDKLSVRNRKIDIFQRMDLIGSSRTVGISYIF